MILRYCCPTKAAALVGGSAEREKEVRVPAEREGERGFARIFEPRGVQTNESDGVVGWKIRPTSGAEPRERRVGGPDARPHCETKRTATPLLLPLSPPVTLAVVVPIENSCPFSALFVQESSWSETE